MRTLKTLIFFNNGESDNNDVLLSVTEWQAACRSSSSSLPECIYRTNVMSLKHDKHARTV